MIKVHMKGAWAGLHRHVNRAPSCPSDSETGATHRRLSPLVSQAHTGMLRPVASHSRTSYRRQPLRGPLYLAGYSRAICPSLTPSTRPGQCIHVPQPPGSPSIRKKCERELAAFPHHLHSSTKSDCASRNSILYVYLAFFPLLILSPHGDCSLRYTRYARKSRSLFFYRLFGPWPLSGRTELDEPLILLNR